jgi:hypothetical protein
MRGGAGGGGGETGDDMMERKRWADRVVASWVNVLRGVEEWWGIFYGAVELWRRDERGLKGTKRRHAHKAE